MIAPSAAGRIAIPGPEGSFDFGFDKALDIRVTAEVRARSISGILITEASLEHAHIDTQNLERVSNGAAAERPKRDTA